MLLDKRIDAFLYLVGFLATFALSMSDTREMEALQRLQPLTVRSEGVAKQVRIFCLRKRELSAKKNNVYREAGAILQ